MISFTDRIDAGRKLAERLEYLKGENPVVLALPRGGVPVAFEVAEALDAPLEVIVVRKLGVPSQPELAMGAIGEEGVEVLDARVLASAQVDEEQLRDIQRRERALLDARVTLLRRDRARVDLSGRVAVIVDDGIATGSTARVACQVARRLGAARVVLAVPVASAETVRDLTEADEADDVVCVSAPRWFMAVGNYYRDFSPTSDDEVIVLLDAAAGRMRGGQAVADRPECDIDVEIPVDTVVLQGHLHLPEPAAGVVLFAHGSGSGRHSPRNQLVAEVLYRAGLGTLLLDLLTPDEELNRANVFDVELLARRLTSATRWLGDRPDAASCRVGYFGASTGAGAALWAAAEGAAAEGAAGEGTAAQAGVHVGAVVSRGGRPDLAGPRLANVRAPTLLIVGGADEAVLRLNQSARDRLRCPSQLAIVEGATHLFEEPGTLAEAATLASSWFVRYLLQAPTSR
ncbi:MAG TPA: phosphoribosyltransferase [Dermatophilaceae bacterium]|nr:phosphoribosyltransferase [Dermatophilaceae bacterium]